MRNSSIYRAGIARPRRQIRTSKNSLRRANNNGANHQLSRSAKAELKESENTQRGEVHVAGTHWIVEGKIDPRWPINTRGNIGEVFPEVLTPLSYTLGVIAAESGWRDAYREIGILRKGDL